MSVFKEYSQYYQLLYHDKDYEGEVKYIQNLLQEYRTGSLNILECGCGTGVHAKFLSQYGHRIHGIDLSSQMITEAQKNKVNNVHCELGDVRNFDLKQEFDAALSLFHVLSYQTSDEDVDAMLGHIAKHICRGGFFIFDYWYRPAVMNIGADEREKYVENEFLSIKRKAIPTHDPQKNLVNVKYEIEVHDKLKDKNFQIEENHPMRYFDLDEVEKFLKRNQFELIRSEEWMTAKWPDNNTWGVCSIARKL